METYMKSDKWNILMVIGKVYSLDILEDLLNGPKRFSDLNKACPIEKTRSKRLKELKENDLIAAVVMERKRRNFVHYKLTEKGESTVRKAREF